jgi:ABC-type lipoprotein export system ATPase subunit
MSAAPPQTEASPPVLEAIDVKREFDDGKVKALRGVNFTIDDGEFISIIGTSGSGKSTLLNMLGSLDTPTSGQLKFKGTHIPDLPDLPAFRAQEVGFIFQSFHLLPTFTVEENVQIPMFTTSKSCAERKERAIELLEAVGLAHRRSHLPSKLSGGERQRAAIARSMANRPSLLLADEPTGNLDTKSANQIMDLLEHLHSQHKTTLVLVTHDMNVANHASPIIQMCDGQIESDTTNNNDAS